MLLSGHILLNFSKQKLGRESPCEAGNIKGHRAAVRLQVNGQGVRKPTGQLSQAEPREEGCEGGAAPGWTPSADPGKAIPPGDRTKSIKTQRNDSTG